MKHLRYLKILLTFSFFPFITFGQLKGEFCHNFGFGLECITFLDNNRFEYDSNNCTEVNEGKGIYKLKGDRLTLTFDTDSISEGSGMVLCEPSPSKTDSVLVTIKANDRETREELVFITVLLKNSKGSAVVRTTTDFEGTCKIMLPKSTNTLNLHCMNIGYKDIKFLIVPDKNYSLKITMKSNFRTYYKSGKILNYKIRNITKKSIELSPDYPEPRYEIYVKK